MNTYAISEHTYDGRRIALFRRYIYDFVIGCCPHRRSSIVQSYVNAGTPVYAYTTGVLKWSLLNGLDVYVLVNRTKPHPIDAWWLHQIPKNHIICKQPGSAQSPHHGQLIHLWLMLILKLGGTINAISDEREAKKRLAARFDFIFGNQVNTRSFRALFR